MESHRLGWRRNPGLHQTVVVKSGEVAMRIALVLAFVVVTAAPLLGIWWAHVWAQVNGMVLRTSVLRMTMPSIEQDRKAA